MHVVHVVPQWPQFAGSLWRSTQLPPQHVGCAVSHALPQEPQLALSVCVSAQ